MSTLHPDKINNKKNNNVPIPSSSSGKKKKTKSSVKGRGKKGIGSSRSAVKQANSPSTGRKKNENLASDYDSREMITPTKDQKKSHNNQRNKEDHSKSPQQVDQFPTSSPSSPVSSRAPRSEARPANAISSPSFDLMVEKDDGNHSLRANDSLTSRAGSKGAASPFYSTDSVLFDDADVGDDRDDIEDGAFVALKTMPKNRVCTTVQSSSSEVGDSILCGRWDVSVSNHNDNNNDNDNCNGGGDDQQRNDHIKAHSTRGNSKGNDSNTPIGRVTPTSARSKVARLRPNTTTGNNPNLDDFGLDSFPAGIDKKTSRSGHESGITVQNDHAVDATTSNNSKPGLLANLKKTTRRIRGVTRFSSSPKSSPLPVTSSSPSPPSSPQDFDANAYSHSKVHKTAAKDTGAFKSAMINDANHARRSSNNGHCKRSASKNEIIHGHNRGCWKGDDITSASDISKASHGNKTSRAPAQATKANLSSDVPSASSHSTVNYLSITYFQQRMIYPDGFFSTSSSPWENETLSSWKAPTQTTTSPTENSTLQAETTQSTPIQAILPKWRAYTGLTEFGFDCYATPKYILAEGGGDENARRKFDGYGCVGWGSDGTIIGGVVASETTSMAHSQLSEPSSSAVDPKVCIGDCISIDELPTAPSSGTSAEEADCDHGGMKAKVTLQPPGHIYALREICFDGPIVGVRGSDEKTEEDEYDEEEVDDFIGLRPRDPSMKDRRKAKIITSRVVCTTENVHLQLEKSSAGTALCPAWKKDDPGSVISGHIFKRNVYGYGPFFYSTGLMPHEGIPPMELQMKPPGRLLLVTVPLSEIKRQIGDTLNDSSRAIEEMDYIGRKSFTHCQYLGYDNFMGVELIHDSIRAVDCAFQVPDEYMTKSTRPEKSEKNARWTYPQKFLKSISQCRHRSKHGDQSSDANNDARLSIRGVARGNVSSSAKNTSAITKLRGKQTSTDKPLAQGVSGSYVPRVVHYFNHGARIFGDEAILNNKIEPIEEIVCISQSLGIYVCESELSASECRHIIDVSEACAASAHGWSSYTYAKQTLGCREHDMLAFASRKPVMRACATIGKHLLDCGDSGSEKPYDPNVTDLGVYSRQESARPQWKKEVVLDAREPHIVKYDLSKKERQKLDMHTDKSIWTFLIALSEGRGHDYSEGGTFFEALNSTVHLQRGQMLIFRGKLRHRGVKISFGTRYLLVGFLVEKKNGARVASCATDASET